jgi:hypothetical protein
MLGGLRALRECARGCIVSAARYAPASSASAARVLLSSEPFSRVRGTAISVFPNVPDQRANLAAMQMARNNCCRIPTFQCPARRPRRGRDKVASSSPQVISSISPRIMSSIGSNQSSNRWELLSILRGVVSPPAPRRR